MPDAQLVFDSSKIQGEIMDLMWSHRPQRSPPIHLGKSLVGEWYETHGRDVEERCGREGRERGRWRKASGTERPLHQPVATTRLFVAPGHAYQFVTSEESSRTWIWCASFPSLPAFSARDAGSVRRRRHPVSGGKLARRCGNVKMRFDHSNDNGRRRHELRPLDSC